MQAPDDDATIIRELHRFRDDSDWLDENFERLLPEYENRWVAVRDCHIIASDPDLDALIAQPPEPGATAIKYIEPETDIVIV